MLTLLAVAVLAGALRAQSAPPLQDIEVVRARDTAPPATARIRGVVTYRDPARALIVVQDDTGGMAVFGEAAVARGDRVQADGRLVDGPLGPTLVDAAITVDARGAPPEPLTADAARLRAGALDGRLVRVRGVVHRVRVSGSTIELELRADAGPMRVEVLRGAGDPPPIDALVEAEGVAVAVPAAGAGPARDRRLMVGDPAQLRVERPAAADPFDAEPVAIDALPRHLAPTLARRVVVEGVVTRQRPGRSLHIRDRTGALYVESDSTVSVSPGDRVRAVGFPEADEFAPYLADADFRRVGTGPPPEPVDAQPLQLVAGELDAELVRTEATYLGSEAGREELTLILREGDFIFNAHVLHERAGDLADRLRAGDRVQVTGICSVIVDSDHVPRSFRVLMRGAADVDVVAAAAFLPGGPWLGWLGLAIALVALGGVGLLYRRASGHERTIRRLFAREASLKASFDDVFERTSDVMVIHDRRGRLSTINRTGEQLTGYAREELRTLDPHWVFGPNYLDAVARMLEEGTDAAPRTFRAELTTRKNTKVPVEVQARVMVGDGAVTGVSLVARDISERDHLEAQLRQAQKMEAVGRLATGVAHDFNNLITVLLSYSDELLESITRDDERFRSVEEIRRAAQRATALTQQLLAFSRRQSTTPQSIDLNVTIANMQDLLRRLLGAEIRLEVALAPDLGLVRADAAQIGQVLMNLAVNARDAMPEGGTLTVETANAELGAEHLDVIPGPHVRLTVRDTGAGMTPDVQRRLFEPFFTTKHAGAGTGLGLSMVNVIVREAGGAITVESAPGAGAAFTLYFPRVDSPAAAEELAEGTAPAEPVVGTAVVLLAEDDRAVRRLMSRELSRRGYTVLEARHGGEALEICRTYGGDIHVLVTDVVMPQMSGVELAAQATAFRPGIKVLYVSGHPERAGVGLDPRGPDAANLLLKPFTAGALAARVHELLKGQ